MALDLAVIDERAPFGEGDLVAPEDFQQLQGNIDNALDRLLVGIVGGPNAMPAPGFLPPLSISLTGGMGITVGGAGIAFVQGRFVDSPPLQAYTLNPATSQNRIDLIAVQFKRAAGSQNINRRVRADNAPSGMLATQVTLLAGVAVVTYPTQSYSANPFVFLTEVGLDTANPGAKLTVAITETQVTITSTDNTDTRTLNVLVIGTSSTADGAPTSLLTSEAQCQYQYIVGTPGSLVPPAAPPNYEAFAKILVHMNETSISPADITYLFPTFAPPIQNFVCTSITTNLINCNGPINTIGNYGMNSGGGITSQNQGVFGIASGAIGVGGTQTQPLRSTLTTDNLTFFGIDGPTALPGTPPPLNLTLGYNTPTIETVQFGFAGAFGYAGATGYVQGGSTYGANAFIAGGSTFAGAALFEGTAHVEGHLTVDGGITGDIRSNLQSADGSVVITDVAGKANLAVLNHIVGGGTSTDGSGKSPTIQTTNQIVSVTATPGQNTGGLVPFQVFVDQVASNFAKGTVVFFTLLTSPSGVTSPVGGVGLYYTIITNNTPHT